MPQTLSKKLKFPRFILLLIIMYNFSPFYWIIILLFSQIINVISLIKSIDTGYFVCCIEIVPYYIWKVHKHSAFHNNNNNNSLHLYSAFLGAQSALHWRGGGGGGTPQPPPVCSIHLDDATAAILRQNAHHTPAYWWRGDSDEANQCMEMIRRL